VHVLADAVLAATGAVVVAVGFSVASMARQFRRANRLLPSRRSPAPLWWRWSPRRAAVLHRRLRRSCEIVVGVVGAGDRRRRWARRRVTDRASVLQAAGADLLERAVAVEHRLVEAERAGPLWRRRELPGLAAEVAAVEAAAARLARLDGQLRAHPVGGEGPDGAESLLDAFEAALGELRPRDPDLHPRT
jgi:hypothetical protein